MNAKTLSGEGLEVHEALAQRERVSVSCKVPKRNKMFGNTLHAASQGRISSGRGRLEPSAGRIEWSAANPLW